MRRWSRAPIVILACAACTDLGGLTGGVDAGPSAPPDGGAPPAVVVDAGADASAPLACDAGSLCGGACVDTRTDAKNCGRCSHDCLGGACAAGTCQPITLAKGLNIPQGLAQDRTSLYVTVWGSGQVLRVAKNGGMPVVLTAQTSSPWSIAIAPDPSGYAAQVIWSEAPSVGSGSAHVWSCGASSCGAPVAFVSGVDDARDVVVLGSSLFVARNVSGAADVFACTLPGCTRPQVLGLAYTSAYGLIAADASTLVFGQYTSLGKVMRVATDGTGAATLFDADGPQGLASDGTNVFAALNDGNAIVKCALGGCIGGATTLAFAQSPHAVAADATNVYWTNGLADGGSVAYCPIAGCPGGAALLAPMQSNPYAILVDDVAVYWVTSAPDGAVMKIAKP